MDSLGYRFFTNGLEQFTRGAAMCYGWGAAMLYGWSTPSLFMQLWWHMPDKVWIDHIMQFCFQRHFWYFI